MKEQRYHLIMVNKLWWFGPRHKFDGPWTTYLVLNRIHHHITGGPPMLFMLEFRTVTTPHQYRITVFDGDRTEIITHMANRDAGEFRDATMYDTLDELLATLESFMQMENSR